MMMMMLLLNWWRIRSISRNSCINLNLLIWINPLPNHHSNDDDAGDAGDDDGGGADDDKCDVENGNIENFGFDDGGEGHVNGDGDGDDDGNGNFGDVDAADADDKRDARNGKVEYLAALCMVVLMVMLMINMMLRMEMLSTWLHSLKVRSRSHRASGRLSNVLKRS